MTFNSYRIDCCCFKISDPVSEQEGEGRRKNGAYTICDHFEEVCNAAPGLRWIFKTASNKSGSKCFSFTNVDELVKSRISKGFEKSSSFRMRESREMRSTYRYVGMTREEAQRRKWTF